MKRSAQIILTMSLVAASSPTFAEKNPHDPYEKWNRKVDKLNDKADRYVMQPVARTYRKITPRPVQTAVSNVANNLRDVVSFGSNLLRGDMARAGNDFMRVSINTTFGLGGLINWADAAGMPNNKNNLGDTFATWGWKNSNYFVYPLLGPSTVRDSVGTTIVTVGSPNRWIIPHTTTRYSIAALSAVDTRAKLLDVTDSIGEAAIDPYTYKRDMYMAYRNKQVGNTQALPEEENIDDLFDESTDSSHSDSTDSKNKTQSSTPEANIQAAPTETNTETETVEPVLQLNMDDTPLQISPEAQQATQEYIDLWRHQAQNNTAFY